MEFQKNKVNQNNINRHELIALLIKNLKSGDVLLLQGDMGAGKTYFTQQLCEAYGIKDVTSPTFTITNHYNIPDSNTSILHSDLYRLTSLEIDLLPDVFSQDSISIIEWPEKISPDILKLFQNYILINIKPFHDNITIETHNINL